MQREIRLPTRYGPELHLLGRGGFGAVFRARDNETGEDVAIKVPYRSWDDDLTREVAIELRAASSLRHENVLSVIDAGMSEDGAPFLVTEFAPRGSVAGWVESGPPWSELLPVIRGALRGLAHAHAHGLVHRDVKPENVLLGLALKRLGMRVTPAPGWIGMGTIWLPGAQLALPIVQLEFDKAGLRRFEQEGPDGRPKRDRGDEYERDCDDDHDENDFERRRIRPELWGIGPAIGGGRVSIVAVGRF